MLCRYQLLIYITMTIDLKKFGTVLVSRPSGKEAYLAFQPILNELKDDEKIEIEFEGVAVLAPSWADEFVTPLQDKYGDKLSFKNTENSSVKATLEMLEELNAK